MDSTEIGFLQARSTWSLLWALCLFWLVASCTPKPILPSKLYIFSTSDSRDRDSTYIPTARINLEGFDGPITLLLTSRDHTNWAIENPENIEISHISVGGDHAAKTVVWIDDVNTPVFQNVYLQPFFGAYREWQHLLAWDMGFERAHAVVSVDEIPKNGFTFASLDTEAPSLEPDYLNTELTPADQLPYIEFYENIDGVSGVYNLSGELVQETPRKHSDQSVMYEKESAAYRITPTGFARVSERGNSLVEVHFPEKTRLINASRSEHRVDNVEVAPCRGRPGAISLDQQNGVLAGIWEENWYTKSICFHSLETNQWAEPVLFVGRSSRPDLLTLHHDAQTEKFFLLKTGRGRDVPFEISIFSADGGMLETYPVQRPEGSGFRHLRAPRSFSKGISIAHADSKGVVIIPYSDFHHLERGKRIPHRIYYFEFASHKTHLTYWRGMADTNGGPITSNINNPELDAAGDAFPDGPEADWLPSCGGVYALCGYLDQRGGDIVIERAFEDAGKFSEGFAPISVSGQYGYIEASGEIVISPRFDAAGPFIDGVAEVVIAGKAGVIDRSGDFILEPYFGRAAPISRDVIIAQPISRGFRTDQTGILGSFNQKYGEYRQPAGIPGYAGIYNLKTGWVIGPSLKLRAFSNAPDAPLWASTGQEDDLYGMIDLEGNWIVPPTYNYVNYTDDEVAIASVGGPSSSDRQQRLVNYRGEETVLPYKRVDRFENGFAYVADDKGGGFVNHSGELIGGRLFDNVEAGNDHWLPRVKSNNKWWSLTLDGDLMPDQREGEILLSCPGQLVLKRENNNSVVYKDGERLLIPEFYARSSYNDGQCEEPIFFYSENLSRRAILPDGTFISDGEKALRLYNTYNSLKRSASNWLICPGGGRLVTADGKWGMKDAEGNIIVPLAYRALSCFKRGTAYAPHPEKRLWCAIGIDGEWRDKGHCKEEYYPYSQTHHSPERLSPDSHESSVLWTVAFLEYVSGLREDAPKMIGDGIQSNISSSIRRQ